jgi:hypothetical protein
MQVDIGGRRSLSNYEHSLKNCPIHKGFGAVKVYFLDVMVT